MAQNKKITPAPASEQPVKKKPAAKKPPADPEIVRFFRKDDFYSQAKWRGVIPVFKCLVCGHFENVEDDMIIHILKHQSKSDHEKILNDLVR